MRFEYYSFRLAAEILSARPAWLELKGVIDAIQPDEIIKEHQLITAERVKKRGAGAKSPAGAQQALNRVFRRRLEQLRWSQEPILFEPAGAEDDSEGLGEWKMDFLKGRIGVEVTFNHAEAIAWTFTRVTLAGESPDVLPDSRIDVGVIIFASSSLKEWGRMDSTVGTFERARLWLAKMRPVMPIPIMLIGLRAETNQGVPWNPVPDFRGTSSGGRSSA